VSGTSDEETKFAPTSQNFTSFAASLFLPSRLVDIIEFVKNFPRLVLEDDDDVAKSNGSEEKEEAHVAPLVKNVVVVVVVVVRAFSTSRSPSSSPLEERAVV
jgi:Na+/H+ antiporter NhaD/arsenite permease-like protein